jgi:hypothetical protein
MGRWEIVERKRAMLAEHLAEQDRQATARTIERNRAARAQVGVILLREDACFLSRKWVEHRFFRNMINTAPFLDSLPWLQISDADGITRDFVRAGDLERALDSGNGGYGIMGALEVFVIRSMNDLDGWARRSIGSPPPRQGGLRSRFYNARAGHFVPSERWRFGAERGPGAFANPAALIADHPIEVGFDHRFDTVLWVRSMGAQADAPARPAGPALDAAPEDAGGPGPGASGLSEEDDDDRADDLGSMTPGPARRHARGSRRKHRETEE